MDKDRIAGVAKQAEGALKDAAGKALGDAKLVAEGKNDKGQGPERRRWRQGRA